MSKIKDFTQSISQLLVWMFVSLLFYGLAKAMEIFGLLQAIDGLFVHHRLLYWLVLIVSRAIYLAIGAYVTHMFLATTMQKKGFLLLPLAPLSEDGNDKSWIIAISIMCLIIAECFIRIVTLTETLIF